MPNQAVQNDEKTEKPAHKTFQIQIDRVHYTVAQEVLTGAELRRVPPTPIGPDRDLFEVVPGGTDKKIEDNEAVEIREGERFFTAPAHINPGSAEYRG
jgi:hypothetical protein